MPNCDLALMTHFSVIWLLIRDNIKYLSYNVTWYGDQNLTRKSSFQPVILYLSSKIELVYQSNCKDMRSGIVKINNSII